jgi:TolA-binding protein
MRRALVAAGLALTVVLAAPFAARAQVESREGIALQNQILELRQQVETLRGQVSEGGGGGSSLGTAASGGSSAGGGGIDASMLDRVQHLEDAVRELRGRVDDADNARQQQFDQLNKKLDDLAFRLDNGGAPRPAGAPAAPAAAATPATPPKRTAELALQEGNVALARRDYPAAVAAAKEVLAAGKGPRMADAQFLLAESLAGQKDYAGAAVAYDDAYKRSRTGTHASESLLGLAYSLNAIGEKQASCETLNKMRGEFPTVRADIANAAATLRRNAGCK